MSQLEDPFNVNFIAPGRESNGIWTKTSFTSSTSNPSNLLKQNWSSVATSSEGKFVLACVYGGKVYSSSNYGYNLQPDSSSILPSSANWSCVTISPDGTKAAACINGGGIFIGTLTGTSWTWESTASATVNWSSVAISGDNLSIAASVSNGSIYIGTYTTYWTWSKNDYSPSGNWSSITFSGDNTNIAACINSSANGNGIYIGYYDIGISDWNFEQSKSPANWSCITKFGSSKNFVACINNSSSGGIYKGIFNDEDPHNPFWDWTITSAPAKNWTSISSDSTGQYIIACVNGGGLYCSIDYGASWVEQTNGLTNPLSWTGVAIATNTSGSFLVGCVQNDYIYISPYFQGYQWNNSLGNNYIWISVASDFSGQNIIAAVQEYNGSHGNLFISKDYGISWFETNPVAPSVTQNWNCVSSNDDGSILGAVILDGGAVISVDSGTTWIQPVLESGTIAPQCSQISLNSSGECGVICSYYTIVNSAQNSGRIYITNNTSNINSWEQVGPSPVPPDINQWTAVKFSSDSNYIFLCCINTQNQSKIYRVAYDALTNTCDFGSGPIFFAEPPDATPRFTSITCSSTGEYIYAICPKIDVTDTNIYLASNYGSNSFQTATITIPEVSEINYGFQGITTSSSGEKIAVTFYNDTAYTGYVYLSLDYGLNWITQIQGLPTTQNAWRSIASDQNFNKLVLCAYQGASNYGGSSGIFTAFLSKSCWTPQLNAVPTRNAFTKLTCSNNGQYLAVAAENQTNLGIPNNDYGGIWISWDYGSTWIKSDAGNLCWNAISSDNTGQYLVAGVYGGQIYTSSNYGLNWTIQSSTSGLPTSANWCAISFSNNSDSSSTSQYVYASVASGQIYPGLTYDGGYIYVSNDRGITWTSVNLFTTWGNGIASSSNGKYMYVGALYNVDNTPPSNIYGAVNFGSSTLQVYLNSFGANWNYVATDATGAYIFAVNSSFGSTYQDYYTGIYVGINDLQSPPNFYFTPIASKALAWRSISLVNMLNYLLITAICTNGLVYTCNFPIPQTGGDNLVYSWTLQDGLPASQWNDIKLSKLSSGEVQMVICSYNGGIWKSSDSGANWTQSTLFYTNSNNLAITSSSSGQNLVSIVNSEYLYGSTDFGLNWNQLIDGPSSQFWYSIASSITGQYIIASTKDGKIYISGNYGQTWSNKIIGGTSSLSISSTGQYMVGAAYLGSIYLSTDYGLNWIQLTTTNGLPSITESWSAISISVTGKYMSATINGGKIYISSNFGTTWVESNIITSTWSSISISNSGQYLVACINGGTIYISFNYGLNWTQLTTTNGLPSNTEDWTSVSISGTGQYIFATSSNGNIYSSSDFGLSWSKINTTNPPATANLNSISSSTSGQYLAAIAVNSVDTSEVNIYNYSNYMDIGNILGSLINQLQIQLQYNNSS